MHTKLNLEKIILFAGIGLILLRLLFPVYECRVEEYGYVKNVCSEGQIIHLLFTPPSVETTQFGEISFYEPSVALTTMQVLSLLILFGFLFAYQRHYLNAPTEKASQRALVLWRPTINVQRSTVAKLILGAGGLVAFLVLVNSPYAENDVVKTIIGGAFVGAVFGALWILFQYGHRFVKKHTKKE